MDSPHTMAVVLAGLYFAGATIGALTLLLPHPAPADDSQLWTNVALAYGASLVIGVGAGRLPVWSLQLALALGTLIITRAVYYSNDPGSFYSLWYVWVGLYAFFFLGRRWGAAHMLLVGVAYAWALTQVPQTSPLSRWVMTVGTIAIAGALIEVLTGQVRQRAADADSRAHQLARVARTDDLTGLANRRAWDEHLQREVARARREGTPLSVALLDLDHFKAYNDRYGHQAGDRLLKETTARWQELIRDTDVLARYGGEEFALALPGAGLAEAQILLERLRGATPGGERSSAGVAAWDGTEDEAGLVARADIALYAAKRSGRDRVVAAGPEGRPAS